MKKKGFTLIELMASLAILTIFMLLVSGAFIQNYKITKKTEELDNIQNQYRNAVMSLEKEIKSNKNLKVIVYDDLKKCTIETSVGETINEVKPLVYIKRPVDSDKSMILYALVINGSRKELQEILVQNIISGDIEDIRGTSTFLFKPTSNKVLINNINNVTAERKVDSTEMININFEEIISNNEKRSYPVSFTIKYNEDEVIDIGKESVVESVDEFISELGKNNINIVGNGGQSVKSTGNSVFVVQKGSLGFNNISNQDINELKNRGWSNDTSEENKNINTIKYKRGITASNITISNNSKDYMPIITNGIPVVDNRNGTKATIVLVNGNVYLSGNLELNNTIIISNGLINFTKNSNIYLNNSVLYSKSIDIDTKCEIKINNDYGKEGNPKGILNDSEVVQSLNTILHSNLETN
ncbi:prepilin-type N-terminal cleavage/methylation domain-containing protein [Clostridium sp. D53t1_180928_C8]|uniref:type II secretion system protein n=1 Tax=Clostridium sp. D53t1_180928_C8 TaxID=2787101 RepID=UPI0018A8E9D7|nr:prepilin-type N-terminal cleavage/methylation domain-containing protein [Clostridium sp. D53t1_180928_C8]